MEKKFIYAYDCPADAIREYIEKIYKLQKQCEKNGKPIPEALKEAKKILLSKENIKFLLNSKYVDFIGAGKTGNEIQFYWKKTDSLPALEVRVKREEDGNYTLSYINEKASKEKDEFLWDEKDKNNRKGILSVIKESDALEDVCEMTKIR